MDARKLPRPLARNARYLAAALLVACGGDATGGNPDSARGDATLDAPDAWGPDATRVSDGAAPDARDVGTGPDARDGGTPADADPIDAPAVTDAGTRDAAVDTPPPPDVPIIVDAGEPCGGCAPGFVCSPSGVCKSPMGVPAFGQVYVIVMENTSRSSVVDNTSAPYINSLLASSAQLTNYQDVTHPSLPNYIALTSGDYWGIACDGKPGTSSNGDCGSFCIFNSDCNANQDVSHLGDQLDDAGLAWRMYGQSMGSACNVDDAYPYAVKHIPFLYYDNLRTNSARCSAHVRDTDDLAGDLGNFRFSMLAPDLCHDMHDDCAPENDRVLQGDDWLVQYVPTITSAPGFDRDGVLFIVWDEGDYSLRDNVAVIVISPLAKTSYSSARGYNHYSLLATIQDGLGLPRLANSVDAVPITDVWQ